MVDRKDSTLKMSERYHRASLCSPVKAIARTPANSLAGYWLDKERYFFIAEHFDFELGRIISVPSIVDTATDRIQQVVALETLCSLISKRISRAITLAEMANATFDMPSVDLLEVSLDDEIYYISPAERVIVRSEKVAVQASLYAPGGASAAFLNGSDLWIRDRRSGMTRALTSDGKPLHAYARESEANLNPIEYRERLIPMALWSPDSQWLLTHQTDERQVPDIPLLQYVPENGRRPVLHSYRFPLPGDPRPSLVFHAFHIASGRVVSATEFPVLVKIWSPFAENRIWFAGDSSAFYFLRSSADQSLLELIEVTLADGKARVVVREAAESGYVASHNSDSEPAPNVRVLPASREVIWFSERDGWGHLYLYDLDSGALKGRITGGDWLVRDLIRVDEVNRRIFLLAGGLDGAVEPGERALCSVNFDGTDFRVLVSGGGDLTVAPDWTSFSSQLRPSFPSYSCGGISPTHRAVAARRSSIDTPTESLLIDLHSGREVRFAQSENTGPFVRAPMRIEALAADGATRLYGALFLPHDFDERGSYPLIDFIYPGPQVSWLPRIFRSRRTAWAQCLAELGFAVLMVDSRRMPLRSREFHQPGDSGGLSEPQLSDHVATINLLCERLPYLNRERIGIFGFSGGGYATARAMLDYPKIFKVGVSVSGNHDSLRYQAVWLEKYGGPPDGIDWEQQSNISRAPKLQGRLFLISGDMDDNVHPCHTLALANALILANKNFDMLIVPNRSHKDILVSPYVVRRIWDYFVTNLQGREPPGDFGLSCSEQEIKDYYRFEAR